MGIVPRLSLFVLMFTAVTPRSGHLIGHRWQTSGSQSGGQGPILQAQTYVDLPLDQITSPIPDLKDLLPADDQKRLPMILDKIGHSVDNFMHNVGDLVANEDLTQQKLNPDEKIKAKQRTQDDYLILHHGYEWGANAEYRMDKNGKRLGAVGLEKGYLVTSGCALSSIAFSSDTQAQSKFRYLGDQKMGTRNTFVLAFAQTPGQATFTTVMQGAGGNEVDLLTQGILWIDKNSFQILRMRSDLLAPNREMRLDKVTTEVSFAQVQLQNNPVPLWLPSDVDVFIEIDHAKYRNLHHYTNYRHYQVEVKIGANTVPEPDAKALQDETPSQHQNATESDADSAPASVSPKILRETEKALRCLQENRLDAAQQYLTHVLTIEPNFADGSYLMGLLLLRRKDAERAVAYLQEALKLSPNHAGALLALGEAQYLEHDYANAIVSLEKYCDLQPDGSQVAAAQKYIEAMRRFPEKHVTGDTQSALPPLAEVTPRTQVNWAPPDVDAEKIDLDPAVSCPIGEVMRSASERVEELVQNLDRYTATENIEHFDLSPLGLKVSRETRKFNYLVEIHQVGTSDLDVEEHRSGWMPTEKIRGYPARTEFPGNIATAGLPMLALIFHPRLQARYEFSCEGLGHWKGRRAWIVHFRQRTDQTDSLLTYRVDNRSVAAGIKGRAWIDAETSQIVAMESDLLHPVPEVQLLRDHQLIQYGPVRFRSKPLALWLPKSAEWYCSLKGHRYYRRHAFSGFLLFSIDDKEEIEGPVKPTAHSPMAR